MPSCDLSQQLIDRVNVGAGEVIILFLGLGSCRTGPADGKWGLSHGHSLGAGSPIPLLTGLALFCCSGKVQNLLSQLLQFVKVRNRLPGLMTTGLVLSLPMALMSSLGVGGGQLSPPPCYYTEDG